MLSKFLCWQGDKVYTKSLRYRKLRSHLRPKRQGMLWQSLQTAILMWTLPHTLSRTALETQIWLWSIRAACMPCLPLTEQVYRRLGHRQTSSAQRGIFVGSPRSQHLLPLASAPPFLGNDNSPLHTSTCHSSSI